MKNITINEISELKESSKSILLIWADGCHACELAKPIYEELSNKYVEFSFYKLQFSQEIMEFYTATIPKQTIPLQLKNEDGSLVLDSAGNPVIVQKITENGTLVLETPIVFPNFLIFAKDKITETNPYGFLGNIGGLEKEKLEYILGALSTQTQEAA